MDKTEIRDAATVIVVRDGQSVLMGQRGAKAAFLPGKFVFPGGAVDEADNLVPIGPLGGPCDDRLAQESAVNGGTLAAAAIRELWEESGQALGAPDNWTAPPTGWESFAQTGHKPNAAALSYFFRAVTPQGRPRRFDARFFLTDAADLVTNPDDFSDAEDELSHLQWVPLGLARTYDLPFITQVVLAELIAHLGTGGPIRSVPFFRNDDEAHLVERLGGADVF